MTLALGTGFVNYEVTDDAITLKGMWKTTTACPNPR